MNTKVCVANMEFLDTQLFNGSPRVPWSQKSDSSLNYLIFVARIVLFIAFSSGNDELVCDEGMKDHELRRHLLSL